MNASLSDSLLLEALQKGDVRSFEELFVRHRAPVYGLIFRLVGNREEAEELTQEVFLRLYEHRFRPRADHNVLAWLRKVAANLSFNALRGRQRQQARIERVAGASAEDGILADPQSAAVLAEEREIVRRVVDTLPENQRACLIFRQMGLSYAEIAAATGVSPGSVGTLLARAERTFKERYLALQGKET